MAGVNAWTNGCMSVLDRSCFSYQVAAGSRTSLNKPVLVIRKSSDTNRSSLPSAASSRQVTDDGRRSAGVSSARTDASVPSRCAKKYSFPFDDEPSRLARHTVSTRGKFSGAPGSSQANRSRPSRSSRTTYCATGIPCAAASSAMTSGLRSNVGYDGSQPIRVASTIVSASALPANRPLPSGDASSSAPKAS